MVLYGTSATAPKVDTWLVRPNEVKRGYNTFQKFTDRYQHGAFSYLPPFLHAWQIQDAALLEVTHALNKNRRPEMVPAVLFPAWPFDRAADWLHCHCLGSRRSAVNCSTGPGCAGCDETALDFLQGYVIQGVVRLPGKLPIMHLVKDEESPVYSTRFPDCPGLQGRFR